MAILDQRMDLAGDQVDDMSQNCGCVRANISAGSEIQRHIIDHVLPQWAELERRAAWASQTQSVEQRVFDEGAADIARGLVNVADDLSCSRSVSTSRFADDQLQISVLRFFFTHS
jgi:predicted NBD/HSP70 family sugar kinase